jgi:protein-L-isoaspartate(D-aspartate) O-methyltransferase
LNRDYRFQRQKMVRELTDYGIRDRRVLEVMGELPRHDFVPPNLRNQAYGDHALPIAEEQTISQPWVVARMTELLEVGAQHSVLEVGTGTGYQTAVLARLARFVYSLERVPTLAQEAILRIRALGFDNVKIQRFDGTVGWSEVAPFDRILVTAGAPSAPKPLVEQLAVGGLMVIPEGGRDSQRLVTYRKGPRRVRRDEGEAVAFVPLLGRHGWAAG